MSSRKNFRNPTHGTEVVNATRFAPHQLAQNKQEKIIKKNKIWENLST
jgi:hypothetical protein